MPGRPQLTSGYDRHAIAWTQVCQVPPLPTCQRYNRRSTTRKLSLRVVFVSGEVWFLTRSVTRSVSGVPRCLRSAEAFETIEHDRDGPSAVRRRSPGRFPGGRRRALIVTRWAYSSGRTGVAGKGMPAPRWARNSSLTRPALGVRRWVAPASG